MPPTRRPTHRYRRWANSSNSSISSRCLAPLQRSLLLDCTLLLLERPRQPSASPDCQLDDGLLSVMYITDTAEFIFLCMFWGGEIRGASGPIDNIHKTPS